MPASVQGRSRSLRLLEVRRQRLVQEMSRVDHQLTKTREQMVQIEARLEALAQVQQKAA